MAGIKRIGVNKIIFASHLKSNVCSRVIVIAITAVIITVFFSLALIAVEENTDAIAYHSRKETDLKPSITERQ